ncbi:MAG: hypothetical protein M3Q36_03315, partial [bacterium]|nr:hypothetical protein [bacterium]
LIVNERWSSIRARYRARKLKTNYVTMNTAPLWVGFIKATTKSNIKLSAYTVNEVKLAKKWKNAGLYAAVTDYPDRINKDL